MKVTATEINEIKLIEPSYIADARGFFMETYNKEKFREAGIEFSFVQENQSGSKQGVLRGIHYQIKYAQGKLVRAVKGEVYDVAVDLRRHSPTFGKYVGEILSAENRKQLWIPPGFGHAIYVLSDWAEFVYIVTDKYSPEDERCIIWNDPDLNIDWPILEGVKILISEKDSAGVMFASAEIYD